MFRPALWGASLAVAVLAPFLVGSPLVPAEAAHGETAPPASRPATAIPGSQATTRPACTEGGVVGAALRELYIIPRNDPAGDSSQAAAGKPPGLANVRSPAKATGTLPTAKDQRASPSPHTTSTAPAVGLGTDKGESYAGPLKRQASDLQVGTSAHYRGGRRLPTHDREWATYRYFGGQPSRYGYGIYDDDGSSYRAFGPYGYDYQDGDIYRFGFMRGYNKGKFDRSSSERAESVAAHASLNVAGGLQFFRKGDYRKAADAYQLAAELDQGDPAARLCAGHALFALGRYREASRFIRRAFELQPRVAYLAYDIRGDYGDRTDFDDHLRALRRALDLAPRDPDRLLVLGYVLYYSDQRAQSYPILAQLLQVDKNDKLAALLHGNARPSDVEVDAAKSAAQPAPAR